MTESILSHLVAGTLPLVVLYVGYRIRRGRSRQALARLGTIPCPKMAPSDWVIYVYSPEGKVTWRGVYADPNLATVAVRESKTEGQWGRLFKDGEMLQEWGGAAL